MTLNEVRNELFAFFIKNDIFTHEDFKNIMVITDVIDVEFKNAFIIKALDSLEQENLIIKVSTKKQDFWVLKSPLHEYKQTLEIPGNLAHYISEVLTKVYDKLEEKYSPPNKLNITTEDIISLASLLDNLTKEND